MRFQFYSEDLDAVPKLSVDGTVPNSIHFSHWIGNTTPAEVKADTSTEIVLNLVASPRRAELTQGINLVVNNHFDTDGVLSVWSVLNGERALEFRDLLISAAEAGDFSEHSSDDGVKVSIAIQGLNQAGSDNDDASPLASFLAGQRVDDDARAYELVLPEVERLLSNVNDYEALWRDGWNDVSLALESFARGDSRVVVEHEGISLITLAPDLRQWLMAISKHARGEMFLIATPMAGGWIYRLDYPYYSWAETVVRPEIVRRDLTTALAMLNERGGDGRDGRWKIDKSEMTSAAKFFNADGTLGVSQLEPDEVLAVLSTKHKVQTSQI